MTRVFMLFSVRKKRGPRAAYGFNPMAHRASEKANAGIAAEGTTRLEEGVGAQRAGWAAAALWALSASCSSTTLRYSSMRLRSRRRMSSLS